MPEPAVSPLQLAYAIAKTHRLRIVPVRDRRNPAVSGDYVTAYVVYSVPEAGAERGERLGRRRDPAELLRFVRQITGQHA